MKNPLNDNDVNGNVGAWMYDALRAEGISHQDQYLCRKCNTIVFEKDWKVSEKCCVLCWLDYNG